MVTFLGNPVSFTGKQLQVGDKALDFSLTTTDLSKKSLADFDGKKKVLSVVPSIDTGICSTQTRRFNEELAGLDNTVVLTVSMDLPFAQKLGAVLKALTMPLCFQTTLTILSGAIMPS
ncbi:thiol peroxidase [Streptococcus pneumoniae]|nr:thiol peroxidase [Streptococcus pneumoniae]